DGGQVRLHPAALLAGAAGRDAARVAVPVRAAARRHGHRAGGPAGRSRGRRRRPGRAHLRGGAGGLGADVAELRADAAALPAVAAARSRAAADRPAVRGHDGRLGPAALRRPRRAVARPHRRHPLTLTFRPPDPAGIMGTWTATLCWLRGDAPRAPRLEGGLVTISVRGVVSRGKGEPVEVTTVLVPEPGPGEALVTVQACGVCHTDF